MVMDDNFILTIDLGTSGPKVVLFDRTMDIVGSAFAPCTMKVADGGLATQDPAEWWLAINHSIQEVLQETKVNAQQIAAISCTAQWSGTVAVDESGNHLSDAIIWMDSRGASQINKIITGFPKVEGYAISKLIQWIKKTGGAPVKSGKDSLAHILYLMEKEKNLYNKTFKFLEPKDFINLKLTGKFISTAETMTLHWITDNRDPNQITYDKSLIKLAGLDISKLPSFVDSTSIIGTLKDDLAHKWGLNPNTKVMGGTPDVHSAAIGSGAVKDFEGHLYIGTSSWLSCHVPFKKTDLQHNMASLPSGIPGRYFIVNEQETSGECIDFFRSNILSNQGNVQTENSDKQFYQNFDRLAGTVPAGSEGLLFFPWLFGERSPIDDHLIRAGLLNLSLHHTQAHVFRAILEGVAYNTKWLLKYVEQLINKKLEYIHFIGGGARSDLWSQILADVLDRPIKQLEHPMMANARGAAYLAAVALRWTTFDQISEKIKIRKVYQPDNSFQSLHENRFKLFIRFYKKNKRLFKEMNHN